MGNEKKFKLFDAVLMAVCVILVVESVAPAAMLGPTQIFWWFFILLLFFLPYGLISAELGTTYPDDGGIYDWIKRAFGRRWAARASWLYWVNFPVWMASLAIAFVGVPIVLGLDLSTGVSLVIQLIFIWIACIIPCFSLADNKWILNLAAIAKVFIIVSLAIFGLYFAINNGAATEYTMETMKPVLNMTSLAFVSLIIFNFLGFEVVTTMASEMPNPKKQVPQAIAIGGVLITIFYLMAVFGVSVAITPEQMAQAGGDTTACLLGSFAVLLEGFGPNNGYYFVILIGILFMYTLLANLVSWAQGINFVAGYAAKNNDMPAIFASETKDGNPFASNIINGIVASILVIFCSFADPEGAGKYVFIILFAINVVALLGSYVLMFPAFLKLRSSDPDRERPYKVPGPKWLITLITILPLSILSVSIIANIASAKIILVGFAIALIIGEVLIIYAKKKKVFPK